MKKDYSKAIRTIINFKKDFDKIDPKTPKKLVGDLGEYYAIRELEKLGFEPIAKGGQGGYDIFLKKLNKRVEVKTSLWKNEGIYPDETIRFWGWRVENHNQKRGGKFDYLVGVGLDDNFSKPKFYIFTYKEAFRVEDTAIGRFKNIKKKIHLFETKDSFKKAIRLRPSFVSPTERKINANPLRFLNKWGKIKT